VVWVYPVASVLKREVPGGVCAPRAAAGDGVFRCLWSVLFSVVGFLCFFFSDSLLRACINPVFSCISDCVTDSLCK